MEIYTNNPKVKERKAFNCKVSYFDRSCGEIYKMIRDQVHLGAKILSDPMPASRRMIESPFRSVVILKPEGNYKDVDIQSLNCIDKALIHHERINQLNPPIDQRLELEEDFKYIDEQLLESALEELGNS